VRAAILAAETSLGGSVYNVTDGLVHTLREIVLAISAALEKDAPRWRLPVAPVKLGVAGAESLAKAIGISPLVSRTVLEKFLEDIAVDGGKIQRELGFQPQFDLTRGWREAIAGSDREIS
jgi:nucleoside-diphosphate-sugar epimerase